MHTQNIFGFLIRAEKLNKLKRTGWVIRGIFNAQSVAAHSLRAAYIAAILAKELNEDPLMCMFIMQIHDLPEENPNIGDKTPFCKMPKEEKHTLEMQNMAELSGLMNMPEALTAFNVFQEQKTQIAHICEDADMLECLLQATQYAEQYPILIPALHSFFTSCGPKVTTEPGRALLQYIKQQFNNLPHTYWKLSNLVAVAYILWRIVTFQKIIPLHMFFSKKA